MRAGIVAQIVSGAPNCAGYTHFFAIDSNGRLLRGDYHPSRTSTCIGCAEDIEYSGWYTYPGQSRMDSAPAIVGYHWTPLESDNLPGSLEHIPAFPPVTFFARNLADNTLWYDKTWAGGASLGGWMPVPDSTPPDVELIVSGEGLDEGCSTGLTGVWQGDDGGTYYIRQNGDEIWWYGEQAPEYPVWANVAYCKIHGNVIDLKWADLPFKGTTKGGGTLELAVEDCNRLSWRGESGGFGGSIWTRMIVAIVAPLMGEPPAIVFPGQNPAFLTGVWRGDDGGIYYMRQDGNQIWWYGEQSPQHPSFANVAYGNNSGSIIDLKWADAPKGQTLVIGSMTLRLDDNGNTLRKTSDTGGFGASMWT
jgi:hypothetical protein